MGRGLQKYTTDMDNKELLKEFNSLVGNADEKSQKRMNEIVVLLKEQNATEEEVTEAFDAKVCEMRHEIDSIRQQIGEEGYKLLPVTYIAEHYFGKTKAWLYQRINGTPIRGKVYTLNAEQKRIFNSALDDIAGKIRSYRLA